MPVTLNLSFTKEETICDVARVYLSFSSAILFLLLTMTDNKDSDCWILLPKRLIFNLEFIAFNMLNSLCTYSDQNVDERTSILQSHALSLNYFVPSKVLAQ